MKPLSCDLFCKDLGINGGCQSCNNADGCAWCSSDNPSCISTSAMSKCDGLITHSCKATCNSYMNCAPCVNDENCGWCTTDAKCYPLTQGPTGCTPLAHGCNFQQAGFDAGSFVGGMFLVIGIVVIGGLVFFLYRRRQAHLNYTQIN